MRRSPCASILASIVAMTKSKAEPLSNPLRVFSVCSGISAASVAWDEDFLFVGYCEIDPFACHVLAHRLDVSPPKYRPATASSKDKYRTVPTDGLIPNFGDFTQLTDDDLASLGRIDVLEGGTPCQAFSTAGRRLGLADTRGNLTLEFVALANRMRCINGLKYVVWENVHGVLTQKDNPFGHFAAALVGETAGPLQPSGKKWTNAGYIDGPSGRLAWRVLDAQFFRGTPQRRRRVWALAALGDSGERSLVPEKVLFESRCLSGNLGSGKATNGEGWVAPVPGVDQRIGAEDPQGDKLIIARETGIGCYQTGDIASPLRVGGGGLSTVIAFSAGQSAQARSVGDSKKVTPTLRASESGTNQVPTFCYAISDEHETKASQDVAYTLLAGSPTGGGRKQSLIYPAAEADSDWIVRKATPLECERLMGFPDGWTDVPIGNRRASNSSRYKACGNSMAVPCIRWIGTRLVNALLRKDA